MSNLPSKTFQLPPEQQAIRDKCFRPSATFVEFPMEDGETSIPSRFEKIVRMYPDRLAVKCKDRSMTYGELNRAANRIARTILATCNGGDAPVALLFEHGVDVIAAILGVLKAGKISVALDPTFPLEKNGFVLRDAESTLIVTNGRNVECAVRLLGAGGAAINIDEIDDAMGSENLSLPPADAGVAMLNYTSGSTGEPKGVIETHRGVLRSVQVRVAEMHTSRGDRFSLLHSVSFSSAYGNLFQALLNGAVLVLFDVKAEGLHNLGRWLEEERITICHSPVALFRELGELLSAGARFPDLRLLRLTGAPITPRDFEIYRRNFCPGAVLEIGMGATEARGICSAFLDGNFAFPKAGSPIGYPRPGKRVLLLDDSGHEVGAGETGEIAVRGRNLNSGYWRRPQLTEAKFLNDGNGESIYLTGDIGRMLPDGFLLHLGRKDAQVKIRGYRVEISEIERLILAHPRIKNVAVVALDRDSGDKYLAAYLVARGLARPSINDLFEFLQPKLPSFMMPTSFVFIDDLPLINGKLDRRVLPLPDRTRPDMGQAYRPPRTQTEERLIHIWQELLEVSPIGIDDNFFHLGGHSLLASRLISRLRENFLLEMPVRSVFELPTVAGLAEWIENHGAVQQQSQPLAIAAVSRPAELPLSYAQEGLWFLDQLEPGSCAYNLASILPLTDRVDAVSIEGSINEIVKRHESLRTVFKSVDGKPHQVVLPSLAIRLAVVDLRLLVSRADQAAEIRRLRTEEQLRPFDLSQGPLLRVSLVVVGEDAYFLLLIVHHIVFDGWSMDILAREFTVLYDRFASGKSASLPDLPVQYADFAVWQKERCQAGDLEAQLAYWKAALKEIPPRLELPLDKPRPPVQTYRGATQSFVLSKTLSNNLSALSRQHHATLFMTLLAAYQILLLRYTGQHDIVIGAPVAGRNQREVEGLIGFFLNMLVLRADLSGNPTFVELLARVREVCLEAYAHQDLPFETLVAELGPQRSLTHNPLFQVTFSLRNTPSIVLESDDTVVDDFDAGGAIARFDLHLFMAEEESGLRGWLNYNTDLFEAATIMRMTRHFQTLLEGLVTNPEAPISELPMLTGAERQQLLVEWNDTKNAYPRDKCIHQLFEAQVEQTPDRIALVFEDRRLTYRELNNRANQVARYLQKLAVGPEILVGLCLERSIEMIVGLLAILKAGGAYVALDPTYPEERLAFMMEDAQPKVLITQASVRDKLPAYSGAVLCLDSAWDAMSRESNDNPSKESGPSELAYMLYTSGSTGKPKGVMIPHRAIVNHMAWMQDAFRFTEDDGIVQKTPISFDASVWEIFAPLLAGSRLIVARPDGHRDSSYLSRLIQEQGATVLQLVPSMLRVMLQDENFTACITLRLVFGGGEALAADLIQNFYARFGTATLWNLYGPTEASIDATYWDCKPDSIATTVLIGRPIANTQVYILDAYRHPVPIGVVGEIYIGGDGVARGYLNRPELTAERFIYHSFDGEPAQRLYRTADLARYLADGNIEFIGRADDQVKIRGYRIELGEIESVLAQHEVVGASAVVVKEDSTGDRQLIAYVVRRADAVAASELRDYLKTKLPDYMVPSAFVFLDSLPLTPNGKVDRRALPEPDHDQRELTEIFVAPRNSVEETIAAVWREILGKSEVGVHDNFFDLGGHSLKATQVISRLRNLFHREIPLRHMFEFPTIGGLAAAIELQEENTKDIDRLLSEIETLTEEQVQKLLDKKN